MEGVRGTDKNGTSQGEEKSRERKGRRLDRGRSQDGDRERRGSRCKGITSGRAGWSGAGVCGLSRGMWVKQGYVPGVGQVHGQEQG